MTVETWHLIPPDPRVEKTATADLSPADLWAELARIGNNWRDVNPRFADIVQRVVEEFGPGQVAKCNRITALEDALREAADVMSGMADHILRHKTETRRLNPRGMFADLQRGGMAARAALAANQPAPDCHQHDLMTAEAVPQVQPGAPVTLTYTNWTGETAQRTIIPRRVWWGSTEWHPEPQWLLTAFDVDKQAERDFALKDFGQPAPSYQGPILVGMEFVWEPNNSRARENIIVTKVVARADDETMIFSRITGPKGLKGAEVWNDESRFREAVVPAITVQDAARVPEIAALIKKAEALRADMLERAQFKIDVISGEQYRIVNAGNTAWYEFDAALRAIAEGRA